MHPLYKAAFGRAPSPEDLECIAKYTKGAPDPASLYLFTLCLCDNDIDRDCEYFTEEALHKLAAIFPGTPGLFDHAWSAKEQVARLYRCEVVRTGEKTADGRAYHYLRGYAYMRRCPENDALIADIEAGIKREVSVGVSVMRTVCSVCGGDLSACGHIKGKIYDSKRCAGILTDPTDAYEWSFVAVPAQPKAGVQKSRAALARAGEVYLDALRADTAKLLALLGLTGRWQDHALAKLGPDELSDLRDCLLSRAEKAVPSGPQLISRAPGAVSRDDNAFMV